MVDALPDLHRFPGLPTELQIKTLSFLLLHSSLDLLSLVMSCGAMYDVYTKHRASVMLPFIHHMDRRELVIAIAHYYATIAPWRCAEDFRLPAVQDQEDYTRKITDFCEKYVPRQGTELRVPAGEFTLAMVAHIQDTHLFMHKIATTLAPDVIRITDDWEGDWPAPSSVEITNITKALYIIDLTRLLFPKIPIRLEVYNSTAFISQVDPAFVKFWTYFPP